MQFLHSTRRIHERREKLGFKGRMPEPHWIDRLADALSSRLGTLSFLAINVAVFAVWIVLNVGILPGLEPFDPFPFSLLTMAVSLEAILLTIIVLISQNFQSRIAHMRAELEFEIDVRTEREVTKLISMLRAVQERLGIDRHDPELPEMEQETDIDHMRARIEQQSK